MNTNTITKLAAAALGLVGLAFVGLTNIHADYLPLLGIVVSYGAAVVILAIAAMDTKRRKRLT
jgi:drug/metabolite transporter (DMT)-like permease